MSSSSSQDDTTDEIMRATYRALSEHGYSATSMSRIADEFEKSKSLIYYHYEDKEELLTHFIGYLLERFESEMNDSEAADPKAQLLEIIEILLPEELDEEHVSFLRALMELRAQAPFHQSYREQFERSDELILSFIVEAIEEGIECGVFRAVNSREVAEFVYSTIYGAIERGVTIDDHSVLRANRQYLLSYLESNLFRYA